MQDVNIIIEIVQSKTHEAEYKPGRFFYHVALYIYLMVLCGILTIYSPNGVAYDNSDGGRALLYILMFGTAVMVLQL